MREIRGVKKGNELKHVCKKERCIRKAEMRDALEEHMIYEAPLRDSSDVNS